MHRTRLLVIAPNTEFRKSLDFALSAEGYDVTSLPTLSGSHPESFDLVVVHDAALAGEHDGAVTLLNRARASILLADKPMSLPQHRFSHYVQTPLLGPALTDAVQSTLKGTAAITK